MLVLAHRGCHAEHPENTLVAFEAAVAAGADGVETDIQVTRDGVPILFHDRHVAGRRVSSFSHAELRSVTGRDVPTLVSALDAWPDIFWNLEIKMPNDLAPVWPILREYRDQRRLLVSSFWHPVAVRAGWKFGLDYGLLVSHRPQLLTSLLLYVPRNLRDRGSIVWEHASLDAGLVAAASRRGVRSFVWGLCTPENHAEAAGWDVAGIITDDVAVGLAAKDRFRRIRLS